MKTHLFFLFSKLIIKISDFLSLKMKLALRWIPTEVWVDVFRYPWITRRKLGRIVHRFENRKFTEFLQFYLHEWGKRTLEDVHLDMDQELLSMTIPQTPLPENIKFFKCLHIKQIPFSSKNTKFSHFDSQMLAFLRHISPLFTGVNLDLTSFGPGVDLTNLRTLFDHLAPMLHGIHSLTFNQSTIPFVEQYFAPELAQVKMLTLHFGFYPPVQASLQAAINFCMNWLTSEGRDPGEPKLLKVYIYWDDFQQFCKAVQQQFLSAKRPCTFAIERFQYICYNDNFDPNFRLDMQNNIGEQLHGEFNEDGDFLILRHQGDFARNKLGYWVKETVWESHKFNVIEFSNHLTIGPIAADANGVNNAMEGEADQPSTSNMHN